ncbi:hypothetical protein [Planctomicrobium sp. SH664]|uniref:hypothetical protein n=1 Tax=Planctomicrobium sp. SH664 TaxID=3448125 RepID=UPI003F5B42E9
MFGFKMFVGGLLLGGATSYVAMQYHVIRTAEGPVMVPRSHQVRLRSAYVDIREWTPATWKDFPEVTEAVVKSGRGELIVSQTLDTLIPGEVDQKSGKSTDSLARQALDTLVPIRFTNPAGAVEAEVLPSTTAAETATNQPFAPRVVTASSASGLPVLERPVPIPQDAVATPPPVASAQTNATTTVVATPKAAPVAATPTQEQKTKTPDSAGEQPKKSEWVQNLFKSMLTPAKTEAAPAAETQASVAPASPAKTPSIPVADDFWGRPNPGTAGTAQ